VLFPIAASMILTLNVIYALLLSVCYERYNNFYQCSYVQFEVTKIATNKT